MAERFDIYREVVRLGIEHGSHESDLYLPITVDTMALVKQHRANGGHATVFINQITKTAWYDVPFHYTPWWQARLGKQRE